VGSKEGESPQGKLTSENNTNQEGQAGYNRPYEELVQGFREFVRQYEQKYAQYAEEPLQPELIIRMQLDKHARMANDLPGRPATPAEKEEGTFFRTVRLAWDALAYDRYEPGSNTEIMVGVNLWNYYRSTRETTVKLTQPVQVRMLDAMTEAVGLPHIKGQAEIEIPEKLRDVVKYHRSQEYQERVAAAKAKRHR